MECAKLTTTALIPYDQALVCQQHGLGASNIAAL